MPQIPMKEQWRSLWTNTEGFPESSFVFFLSWLIHNVLIVPGVQQTDSDMYTYTPFWTLLQDIERYSLCCMVGPRCHPISHSVLNSVQQYKEWIWIGKWINIPCLQHFLSSTSPSLLRWNIAFPKQFLILYCTIIFLLPTWNLKYQLFRVLYMR